jgi:hypothetical protein
LSTAEQLMHPICYPINGWEMGSNDMHNVKSITKKIMCCLDLIFYFSGASMCLHVHRIKICKEIILVFCSVQLRSCLY